MWYMIIPPLFISAIGVSIPSYIGNFLVDHFSTRTYKVETFLETLGFSRDMDDKRVLLDWDALPED